MRTFGKKIAGIFSLIAFAALLASCTTQYSGEVEGEYKNDGTMTEIALDSSAGTCAGWSAFYAYAYVAGGNGEPLGSWPGTMMEQYPDENGVYYAQIGALGDGITYTLIYNDNAGNQFDAGTFRKGDSKIWNASGEWADWHWEQDEQQPEPEEESGTEKVDEDGGTQDGEGNPDADEEETEDTPAADSVLPGFIRGGDGIGGDAQALSFEDTDGQKTAVYEWTAAQSSWGAGDGNIAFKLTEFGDWNQHGDTTAAGGTTWSGNSSRMEIAVGSGFVELKKCTTNEEASLADNIIATGITAGNAYRLTVKAAQDGTVSVKIEEIL
ncbi:MAG: starch-binding protein [Treponema sp.]|uniref:starch-binding protein n=1 Tax=Treponema sp. TaxID=166 RepID=UPI002580A7DA|nr:starch-binding protein [Treponema sp.]MBQ5537588.1 starch-binding protein [Treponema sp.]